MKKFSFIAILTFCVHFNAQTQNVNFVDSSGYKQGLWVEYRVEPSEIISNGLRTYSIDSSYIMIDDLLIYDKRIKKYTLLKQVGQYKNSLRVGIWSEYTYDGRLHRRVNYKDGIINGECTKYYKSGSMLARSIISNSKFTLVEYYKQTGELHRVDTVFTNKVVKSFDGF